MKAGRAPAVVRACDQAAAALHVDARASARTVEVIATWIGARAVAELLAVLAAHAGRAVEVAATGQADAARIRIAVVVVARERARQREADEDPERDRSEMCAWLH